MTEIERKNFAVQLKAETAGEVEAVWATIRDAAGNPVVDADGDAWGRTAIPDGQPVIIGAWGHDTSRLPIGKGRIERTATEARVVGELFLNTTPGIEAYKTLRGLGGLAQWSVVYSVEKSHGETIAGQRVRMIDQVRIFSVDPVLAAAGVRTRTTRLKGQHSALADAARGAAELQDAIAKASETMARLEIRDIHRKFLTAERDRATAEFAREFPPVPDHQVHPMVKMAARSGMRAAAQRLGVAECSVRWFWHREGGAKGFTRVDVPEILVSAALNPEEAFWVACHEMSHQAQGVERKSTAEEIANAAAHEIFAEMKDAGRGPCHYR